MFFSKRLAEAYVVNGMTQKGLIWALRKYEIKLPEITLSTLVGLLRFLWTAEVRPLKSRHLLEKFACYEFFSGKLFLALLAATRIEVGRGVANSFILSGKRTSKNGNGDDEG